MGWLSLPQCLGYLAFILGVTAFLQRGDRRLKLLLAGESAVYAVHFALLGNFPASGNGVIAAVRNCLSMKTDSRWVAVLMIAASISIGLAFAHGPAGWLTVIASCISTVAMFSMRGLPLRLVLLASTLLWLANNVLSHSIGGIMLETTIAATNLSTIVRMARAALENRRGRLQPLAGEAGD